MKFLKRFLISLCLILVVLVVIFYAQKIQEKRVVSLIGGVHKYLTDMGNLETMKIDYQKDVNVGADVLPNLVNPGIVNSIEKKKTYSFNGSVSAGIDLKELQLSGMSMSRGVLKLDLPIAKILQTSTSYIPSQTAGEIGKDTMLKEATTRAIKAMNDAAASQNISELAKVNAEKKIKEMLLKKFGSVKDVIFE